MKKYIPFLLLLAVPFVMAQLPVGTIRSPIVVDANNVVQYPTAVIWSNQMTMTIAPTVTNQVVRYQDLVGATNTISTNDAALYLGKTSNSVSSTYSTSSGYSTNSGLATLSVTTSNLVSNSGITTNLSVMNSSSGTNTLVITNGIIKAITTP